jgi:hypothetical protein
MKIEQMQSKLEYQLQTRIKKTIKKSPNVGGSDEVTFHGEYCVYCFSTERRTSWGMIMSEVYPSSGPWPPPNVELKHRTIFNTLEDVIKRIEQFTTRWNAEHIPAQVFLIYPPYEV